MRMPKALTESYEKDKLLRILQNTQATVFFKVGLVLKGGRVEAPWNFGVYTGVTISEKKISADIRDYLVWVETEGMDLLDQSLRLIKAEKKDPIKPTDIGTYFYDLIINPKLKKKQQKSLDSLIEILHNRFQSQGYICLDSGFKSHLHSLRMLGKSF